MMDNDLMWDAHCCVPLLPDTPLAALLQRHHQAGFRFVSINIGMDMIPLTRILQVLDHFRREIAASDYLMLARSASDVTYAAQHGRLAVAFDLEGGRAFCESPHMVQLFASLGVRQALLAYNRNNTLAGGCFDQDGGLSASGKTIITAMQQHGILIDCAHTGFRSAMEIIDYAQGPVIFSHANPFAMANNERNLKDVQLRACAATGGVIGIAGLSWLLGEENPGPDALVRHIDYVANLVGLEHVAIGLDFVYEHQVDDIPPEVDLNYWWPGTSFDDRQFACSFFQPEAINQVRHMLQARYGAKGAALILGQNMLNLAQRVWPIAPLELIDQE